jgi:Protein of unknown function (DUF3575)
MSTKFIIRLIALAIWLAPAMTFAQPKDTVFTTITTTTSGSIPEAIPTQYETEQDRLFGMKTPSRWMVNVQRHYQENNGFFSNDFRQITVGGEFKLSPSLSLMGSLNVSRNGGSATSGDQLYMITLQERWYHNMAKGIREGRRANNFSGNYVALAQTLRGTGGNRTWLGHQALYGIQRRFKKHGFFDFSMGLRYENNTNFGSNDWRQLGLAQNLRFGLGIFEKSAPKTDESYCTVLRCFDEESRMVKVDLLNAISFFVIDDPSSTSFLWSSVRPNLAIEQKIGASPFSVEVSGAWTHGRSNLSTWSEDLRVVSSTMELDVELRYFYAQRKRIAQGRSGNNLSGPFLALHTGYEDYKSHSKGAITDLRSDRKVYGGHIGWGYQQRLLKHGYAQFRLGLGVDTETSNYTGNPTYKSGLQFSSYGGLQVGFAF